MSVAFIQEGHWSYRTYKRTHLNVITLTAAQHNHLIVKVWIHNFTLNNLMALIRVFQLLIFRQAMLLNDSNGYLLYFNMQIQKQKLDFKRHLRNNWVWYSSMSMHNTRAIQVRHSCQIVFRTLSLYFCLRTTDLRSPVISWRIAWWGMHYGLDMGMGNEKYSPLTICWKCLRGE